MPDGTLNVRRSDHAELAYSTLGVDDRARLDTWFRQLRNWRSDSQLRTEFAKCLDPREEVYKITTSTGYVIVFKIVGNEVLVLSILSEDMVRAFEEAGRNAR